MARLFDDASSQYLEYSGAVVTAEPLTMACWFRSDDTTLTQCLMYLGVSSTGEGRWQMMAAGAVGGDPVEISSINTSLGSGTADTTTGFSANTWHHACGVFTSSTSRTVYIDGGSSATNTTSITVPTPVVTAMGMRWQISARGRYMSGRIAEAAIWNVALTSAEVAVLAAGMCPLFVRPASLVSYWPLIGRYSPELDLRGIGPMTVTGATADEHCRIVCRAPQLEWWQSGAVPAGGLWRRRASGLMEPTPEYVW